MAHSLRAFATGCRGMFCSLTSPETGGGTPAAGRPSKGCDFGKALDYSPNVYFAATERV